MSSLKKTSCLLTPVVGLKSLMPVAHQIVLEHRRRVEYLKSLLLEVAATQIRSISPLKQT